MNSVQSIEAKPKSLVLNGSTYLGKNNFAVHNASGENLDVFLDTLKESGVEVDMYDGNFSFLLDISPHMAALNINVFNDPEYNITAIYNDTTQHSLPIVINFINNALYK